MPRAKSPINSLKDHLADIEKICPMFSHFITLIVKCFLVRANNVSLLLAELIIPLCLTFLAVIINAVIAQISLEVNNMSFSFNLNMLFNRPLYVEQASPNLQNYLANASLLMAKACSLGPVYSTSNLLNTLQTLRTRNTDLLPLGLRIYKRASTIDLQIHAPHLLLHHLQYERHTPYPISYDHLKDSRFGYSQSGFLALQRCAIWSFSMAQQKNNTFFKNQLFNWQSIRLEPFFFNQWSSYFVNSLSWPLAQCIAIGGLLSALLLGEHVHQEYRRNTRDLLRVLGVRTTLYWLSHFVIQVSLLICQAMFELGLLHVLFIAEIGDQVSVHAFSSIGLRLQKLFFQFPKPSMSLMCIILLAHVFMQSAFSLLMARFWKRRRAYIIFQVICAIVSVHLPRLLLDFHFNLPTLNYSLHTTVENKTSWLVYLSLIFPHSALAIAMQQVQELCDLTPQLTLKQLLTTKTSISERFASMNLEALLLFMVFMSIIYLLICILSDQELHWIFHFLQKCTYCWNQNKAEFSEMDDRSAIVISNLSTHRSLLLNRASSLLDVNMQVQKGKITALVGLDGVGQSHLIRTLAGLKTYSSSAKIRLASYDLANETKNARLACGFCFERDAFYPQLSVQANLVLFCALRFIHIRVAIAEANLLAHVLQLNDYKKRLAYKLSSDQKRKLALAFALAGGCSVIIIDEPTKWLGQNSQKLIWQILIKLKNADRAILVSTHDTDEALAIADQLAIIGEGRLLLFDKTSEFVRQQRVGYQLQFFKNSSFESKRFEHIVGEYFRVGEVQFIPQPGGEFTLLVHGEKSEQVRRLVQALQAKRKELGCILQASTLVTGNQAVQRVLQEQGSLECEASMSNSSALFAISATPQPSDVSGCSLGMNPVAQSHFIQTSHSPSTVPQLSPLERLSGYAMNNFWTACFRFRHYHMLCALLFLVLLLGPITLYALGELFFAPSLEIHSVKWQPLSSSALFTLNTPEEDWQQLRLRDFAWDNKVTSGLEIAERLACMALVPTEVLTLTSKLEKSLLPQHKAFMAGIRIKASDENTARLLDVLDFRASYHDWPSWVKKRIHEGIRFTSIVQFPRNGSTKTFLSNALAQSAENNLQAVRIHMQYEAKSPNAVLIAVQMWENVIRSLQFNESECKRPFLNIQPLHLHVPGLDKSHVPFRLLLFFYLTILICFCGFAFNGPLLFLQQNKHKKELEQLDKRNVKITHWPHFWIGCFFFDYFYFILSLCVVCITRSLITENEKLFQQWPLFLVGSLSGTVFIPLHYLLGLCSRDLTDYSQWLLLLHCLISLLPSMVYSCMQLYLPVMNSVTITALDLLASFRHIVYVLSPGFCFIHSLQILQDLNVLQRMCSQIPKNFLREQCEFSPKNFNPLVASPLSQNLLLQCCSNNLVLECK